jgi:hypothetical protein
LLLEHKFEADPLVSWSPVTTLSTRENIANINHGGQRLQLYLLLSTTNMCADHDHDDAIEPTDESALDCDFPM